MRVSLIAAMAANRVIGHKGTIPWKVPGEQKMFKEITMGHCVIMGRKTHEDIGQALPGRTNIVMTRQLNYQAPGCIVTRDLRSALESCPADETEAFIIGGAQLYRESLSLADRIYLTVVPQEIEGDAFFPEFSTNEFEVTKSELIQGAVPYHFYIYDRVRQSYHMTSQAFRRYGKAVVDWIADYYEQVESLPVLSRAKPGQIRASLPSQPPDQGEAFETILKDVNEYILPGVTHWQSPNFYAFFPANTSGPAILGEMISAGLGVQGMLWATSPACTELETHVLDWLVHMLALPEKLLSTKTGGGVIQDSASSAALCALLAAREQATDYASNDRGCDGRLVAYASNQAHSSIEKAVRIAGIGRENLRLIEVDDQFAMRPEALAQQIEKDRNAGLVPCYVAATVGTTSSNAMDPLPEIGRICRSHGIWLHVDAAMAGTAALCPEFRWVHRGLELADSYCFNPHKWMFTNFDCDCFYVADRKRLIDALSILPEYLRNKASESGAVIDYRDWQVSLGRRFRALKLWFVIRHYGLEGLRHHVRRHVQIAQDFAAWVQADPRFELVVPPPLNLVCFRVRGKDGANQLLMDRLNRSGDLYLTHTRLNDRLALRLCVGQSNTELRHVQRAWQRIQEEAANLPVLATNRNSQAM
jgi:aromatic-L-amino-acid decarboxylase